jgi:hypothetical protein
MQTLPETFLKIKKGSEMFVRMFGPKKKKVA